MGLGETMINSDEVKNMRAGKSDVQGAPFNDAVSTAVSLGDGISSTFIIKENGSLWATGNNYAGRLGIGGTQTVGEPERVGKSYLTMDKYLYSLSVGGEETPNKPVKDSFNLFDVSTGTGVEAEFNWQTWNGKEDIVKVDPRSGKITAVGVGTTYVIVNIVGDSVSTAAIKVEVAPSGAKAFPQVALGNKFSAALRADGTVWTWGNNDYGQLGNGSYNGNTTYPEKVSGLSNIIKIAAAHATQIGRASCRERV